MSENPPLVVVEATTDEPGKPTAANGSASGSANGSANGSPNGALANGAFANGSKEPDRVSEVSATSARTTSGAANVPAHIKQRRSVAQFKQQRSDIRNTAKSFEMEGLNDRKSVAIRASVAPGDKRMTRASIRQSVANLRQTTMITGGEPLKINEEKIEEGGSKTDGIVPGATPMAEASPPKPSVAKPPAFGGPSMDALPMYLPPPPPVEEPKAAEPQSTVDAKRKWYRWIILMGSWFCALAYFFTSASEEPCPFLTSSKDETVDSTVHQELYENARYGRLGVLRHLILPWVASGLVLIHWDHRGRIKRKPSMLHTLTKLYSYLLFSYSVFMYIRVLLIERCPFDEFVRTDLFELAIDWNRSVYMISLVILAQLMCMKISTLADKQEQSKVSVLLSLYGISTTVQLLVKLNRRGNTRLMKYYFLLFSVFDLILFCRISYKTVKVMSFAKRVTMTEMEIMEDELDEDLRKSRVTQGTEEYTMWKKEIEATKEAAEWTNILIRITIGTAMSTTCFLVLKTLNNLTLYEYQILQDLASVAVVLDITLNALCTGVLSGLVGPREQAEAREEKLKTVGNKVLTNQERAVCDKLAAALKLGAQNRSNEAAALASMMGNKDPEIIFENSIKRFRAVDWDKLKDNLDIFRGGTLDGQKAAEDLLEMSFNCEIGECDAFLSHSWHDDCEEKIKELTNWCENFRALNNVPPVLWVDKLCIDQTDIASDLECLPVFLAGCGNMLVMSGHTYTSRLWCIVELFVYVNMQSGGADGDQLAGLTVIPLGKDTEERNKVWSTWTSFQADACNCFAQSDKDHIMAIIRDFEGGIEGFNASIVKLVQDVMAGKTKINNEANKVKMFKQKTRGGLNSEKSSSDLPRATSSSVRNTSSSVSGRDSTGSRGRISSS
jgi:hypothetical protein